MPRGKPSAGAPSRSPGDLSSGSSDHSTSQRRTGGSRHSRGGCFECKRRKVKVRLRSAHELWLDSRFLIHPLQCQETLPACENCIRLKLQCRYLSHGANPSPGQAVTLHENQIFNLTDMRLFHHYFVAAYPHYPVRNDNIWISYVTPISHQVLHSIVLSISQC